MKLNSLKENTHLNKNESKIKDINETIRSPKISRKSDMNLERYGSLKF